MNEQQILLAIGGIGVAALGCQWLAWRLKLPAILFLLLSGILAGPLLGWLDPQELFGPLLMPMVSLAVALILFEGSLTLRLSEWHEIGRVVRRLVTIGALSTWAVISLATHWLLGFDWMLALLFGTLTLVTGPTVIVPMLRVVRPGPRSPTSCAGKGLSSTPSAPCWRWWSTASSLPAHPATA